MTGSDDSAVVPAPANATNQGTPPANPGGTGVADQHSNGHSDVGTDQANQASDGPSSAGSANAGSHRK